jgi:hypothetical protein
VGGRGSKPGRPHLRASKPETNRVILNFFQRTDMPEQETLESARRDKAEGKAASTQAGEFIREEMRHIREGKHGARSTKQAIAIGLSKASRAGVKLRPPAKGKVSEKTRRSAESAYRRGQSHARVSARRSRATERALQREGHRAASRKALSRHAHSATRGRSAQQRSASARKAARTRHWVAHEHAHN